MNTFCSHVRAIFVFVFVLVCVFVLVFTFCTLRFIVPLAARARAHLELSYGEVDVFSLGVFVPASIQASELVAENPSKLTAEHGVA